MLHEVFYYQVSLLQSPELKIYTFSDYPIPYPTRRLKNSYASCSDIDFAFKYAAMFKNFHTYHLWLEAEECAAHRSVPLIPIDLHDVQ